MNKAVSLVLSVLLLLYVQRYASAQQGQSQEDNKLKSIQAPAGGDSIDTDIKTTGIKESADAKIDSLNQNREKQKTDEKQERTDPELRKEKRMALVIGLVFGLVYLAHYILNRAAKSYGS